MVLGVKGKAPGSWKTIVTISFPMCLFLSNYKINSEKDIEKLFILNAVTQMKIVV